MINFTWQIRINLRLNIYAFEKVINAVDKNTGNCLCNLGGKEGFSKHNIGERKGKLDNFWKNFAVNKIEREVTELMYLKHKVFGTRFYKDVLENTKNGK